MQNIKKIEKSLWQERVKEVAIQVTYFTFEISDRNRLLWFVIH